MSAHRGTARVAENRLAEMKVGRLAEIDFEQNPTCRNLLDDRDNEWWAAGGRGGAVGVTLACHTETASGSRTAQRELDSVHDSL